MNPRLLITGVSGFLGGKLARRAQGRFTVLGTWHRRQYNLPGVLQHRVEISSQGFLELLIRLRPEIIIHTAALARPAEAEQNPELSRRVNVEPLRLLGAYGSKTGCRLIALSSDQVYEGTSPPYAETDPARPVNVYGRHKLEGEEILLSAYPEATVIRAPLLLGRPAFGGTSFSEWILGRFGTGGEIPLYVDQIRSAVSGETLAEGLLQCTTLSLPGVWNAGGVQAVSRLDVGRTLLEILGLDTGRLKPVEFSRLEDAPPAPLDITMDSRRFQAAVQLYPGDLVAELKKEYLSQ